MLFGVERNTLAWGTLQVQRSETLPSGESLGDRVRRLRKARRWKQADLADKVGVDRVAVSNWERGKYEPKGAHLVKLADVLRADSDEAGWHRRSGLRCRDHRSCAIV